MSAHDVQRYRALAAAVVASVLRHPDEQEPFSVWAQTEAGRLWLAWLQIDPARVPVRWQ